MDSAREANSEPPRKVNLDQELIYWRDHYISTPFYRAGMDFDDYGPALKLGIHEFLKSRGRSCDEVTAELGETYERTRGASRLEWREGRIAMCAAWERMRVSYPRAAGFIAVPAPAARHQAACSAGSRRQADGHEPMSLRGRVIAPVRCPANAPRFRRQGQRDGA